MTITLSGRTALVTGAGRGLGRTHALALARAGARVVVNDLAQDAADAVAREIADLGGEAVGHAADVADFAAVQAMVAATGPVDILVANAGILRDRSFAKMDMADFRLVLDVHLMGSVHCAKAVWDGMRERGYGRIVFTTSSSGLYGNFGQANYGAAKMALVGLMQTLGLEGQKNDIRVNCLAPTASTEMTQGLLPAEILAKLQPDAVSPAVVALAGPDAPTRAIVLAGAGTFAQAHVTSTRGLHLGLEGDVAGTLAERMAEVADRTGETIPTMGAEQGMRELAMAADGKA